MNGRYSVPWVAAVSALVAGIAGLVVGFMLARSKEQPVKVAVAPAPSPAPSLLTGASSNALLLTTLDNDESGKAATEGERSVQIIFTFETEDERYCRAFGSRDASAAAQGIACRDGDQWQVVAWDGTADQSEGFRSSELIEDVMDRLGGGAALEGAEERALIERHWTAPQR